MFEMSLAKWCSNNNNKQRYLFCPQWNLILFCIKNKGYTVKKNLNSCFSYCFLQSSWYNQEVIGSNQEVRPEILGFVPGKVSVTGFSIFWTSWWISVPGFWKFYTSWFPVGTLFWWFRLSPITYYWNTYLLKLSCSN